MTAGRHLQANGQLRRLDMVGVRTSLGAAAGLVGGVIASLFITWQAAVLVGWVVAATTNLLWTWLTVAPLDAKATRVHANVEDPSQGLSEALVIAAAVALLAAVGLLLVRAGQAHGTTKAYLIAVGILAVVASWTTAHTVFTLRYARSYYRGHVGGIDFNEDDPPAYLDFAYLAFTIGMTFQVSDTDLTAKGVRRIALAHALLSYLFGAIILALSINVVAGLLQ